MERVDIRDLLAELKRAGSIKIPQSPRKWEVMVGAERFVVRPRPLIDRARLSLFSFLLRNAKPVTSYFGLDDDSEVNVVTIGLA